MQVCIGVVVTSREDPAVPLTRGKVPDLLPVLCVGILKRERRTRKE